MAFAVFVALVVLGVGGLGAVLLNAAYQSDGPNGCTYCDQHDVVGLTPGVFYHTQSIDEDASTAHVQWNVSASAPVTVNVSTWHDGGYGDRYFVPYAVSTNVSGLIVVSGPESNWIQVTVVSTASQTLDLHITWQV